MIMFNDFVYELDEIGVFASWRHDWLEASNEEDMVDYEMVWDLEWEIRWNNAMLDLRLSEAEWEAISQHTYSYTIDTFEYVDDLFEALEE